VTGPTQVVGYSPTELAEREAHAARVALAKMWAQSAPRGLRLKQLERWGIDCTKMRAADLTVRHEAMRYADFRRAQDARHLVMAESGLLKPEHRTRILVAHSHRPFPLVRPRLKAPVAP
jgi:hypothetical protein